MASNPHLNKYKSELTTREHNRRDYNRSKALKKVALGVGAIGAAAGAIHTLHPKGIIGAFDSVVDEHSRSALRALKETDYNRHLKDYLNENKTLEDAFGAAKRSVADNYSKILKDEKARFAELKTQEFRRRTSEAAGRVGQNLKDDKLHNRILNNLDELKDNKSNSTINKEVDRLKSDLSYKLTSLAKQDKGRIKHELKKRDFSDQVVDAAAELLQQEGIASAKVDNTAVKNTAWHIKKKADDYLVKKNQKSDNFFNRVLSKLTGYERASGEDLLKLHNTGKFKLDDETSDFLRNLNRPDKFIPDKRLYMYGGELVDGRNAANFLDKGADFFSDGLIGRMMHLREAYQYKKNNEKPVHVMRAGYNLPILENSKLVDSKGRLNQTVYGIGETIYSYSKGELNAVKDGVHFASGRFGRTRRLMAQMSGINAPEGRNMVAEALDISKSREPGAFSKAKSFFGKFNNDEWMPNKIKNIFKEQDVVITDDAYVLGDYLDIYSKGINDNVLQHLIKDTEFEGLSFANEKDIIESYKKLTSQVDMNKYDRGISNQFERQFYSLMDVSKVVQKPGAMSQNEMQFGIDLIRRDATEIIYGELIDQNIKNAEINEVVDDSGVKLFKQLKSLLEEDKISKSEFNDSMDTLADFMYKDAVKSDYGAIYNTSMLDLLYSGKERTTMFQEMVTDMTGRTHPWHSSGPSEQFYDNFHANTIAVNKTFKNIDVSGEDWLEKSMNVSKSLFNIGKGIFTHGRGNMNEVNTADLFAYGLVNAPNEIMKRAGVPVGLSDASLGSTGSSITNMFTKRILPAYAGYQAFNYANDYSDEWDSEGYTIKQRFERAKAHTKLSVSKIKDATGMTDALKWLDSVTPGSENLEYSLGSIPLAGWAARGTGVFSEKSHDEWVEYFATGEDPVRKGRNWILSTGPWMGEGIDYFEPNSYRRAMSEWKYTDTVYGSKDEYWSKQWLPTPRHPLAPVQRLLDPYWFEKMHMKDRPFEVSGAAFDPNTPWGIPLNQTLGRLIKPRIKYTTGASKKDREMLEEMGGFEGLPVSVYEGGSVKNINFVPKGEVHDGVPFVAGEAPVYDEETSSYSKEVVDVPLGETRGAGNRAGNLDSMQNIAMINQSIRDKAGAVTEADVSSYGYSLPNQEFETRSPEGKPQNPGSLRYAVEHGTYIAKGIFGGFGFVAGIPFGNDYGAGKSVLDSADNAYAPSSRFWDMNIGGLGGLHSEYFRRYFKDQRSQMHKVNNLDNLMPGWMPGDDYFINFKKGDPYSHIGRGEIRLPGEAYESLQPLHSDEFGRYGAVDRAAILADVAPYSKEFELWKQIAQSKDLSPEEEAFLNQALEQSKEQKSNFFLTPYKFLNNPVKKRTGTVKKFIDSNRFMIEEDDKVYSLAGVDTSFDPESEEGLATLDILKEHMSPGSEVQLIMPENSSDKAVPVAAVNKETNINRLLLNSGVSESSEETPVDPYVKHTAAGRSVGRAWEFAAHAKIPILHSKFIAVSSPDEHYKDKQVYGKEYQNWNKPINDFVKPTYQSLFARNPIAATGAGLVPGYIMGRLVAGKKWAGKFAVASALISGAGSLFRAKHELDTGKAWIPKEKERERELRDYFDRLEYVKNKRLFEKYKAAAKKEESVDLDKIISNLDKDQEEIRKKQAGINKLSNLRQEELDAEDYVITRMNENGRMEHKVRTTQEIIQDKSSYLQKKIDETKQDQVLVGLGPLARKALEYKEKYESTVYGLDENATFSEIFSALPRNEREYFQHFSEETDPKKREEILQMVPKNIQRIYKTLWGMKTEEKDSLKEYFKDYYLPDSDWIGWKEGVRLEDSMIKVAEDEGMDLSALGLWKDYSEDEKLTPAPYGVGGSFTDDTAFVRSRIRSVLKDYDLNDIDVEIIEREDQEINVNFDFTQDVKPQVSNGIRAAMGG